MQTLTDQHGNIWSAAAPMQNLPPKSPEVQMPTMYGKQSLREFAKTVKNEVVAAANLRIDDLRRMQSGNLTEAEKLTPLRQRMTPSEIDAEIEDQEHRIANADKTYSPEVMRGQYESMVAIGRVERAESQQTGAADNGIVVLRQDKFSMFAPWVADQLNRAEEKGAIAILTSGTSREYAIYTKDNRTGFDGDGSNKGSIIGESSGDAVSLALRRGGEANIIAMTSAAKADLDARKEGIEAAQKKQDDERTAKNAERDRAESNRQSYFDAIRSVPLPRGIKKTVELTGRYAKFSITGTDYDGLIVDKTSEKKEPYRITDIKSGLRVTSLRSMAQAKDLIRGVIHANLPRGDMQNLSQVEIEKWKDVVLAHRNGDVAPSYFTLLSGNIEGKAAPIQIDGRRDAMQRIKSAKADMARADAQDDLDAIYDASQRLDVAVADEVQARADSGEMSVFKGGSLTYAVHPATDGDNAWQVTTYNDSGALGDTRYKTLKAAIRDSRVSGHDLLAAPAATLEMGRIAKAEAEYQARKNQPATPKPEPGASGAELKPSQQPVAGEAPDPVTKEPWQMTRAEYTGQQPPAYRESVGNAHRRAVAKAIADGKPVPSEILADYPAEILGAKSALKRMAP